MLLRLKMGGEKKCLTVVYSTCRYSYVCDRAIASWKLFPLSAGRNRPWPFLFFIWRLPLFFVRTGQKSGHLRERGKKDQKKIWDKTDCSLLFVDGIHSLDLWSAACVVVCSFRLIEWWWASVMYQEKEDTNQRIVFIQTAIYVCIADFAIIVKDVPNCW